MFVIKFRIICISLVAILLTGCGNRKITSAEPESDTPGISALADANDHVDSVPDTPVSLPDTFDDTLELLRKQAAQEGCLCAIAEIGYVSGEETPENIIAESKIAAQYPFLMSAPLISIQKSDIYAIVPVYPDSSVQIEEIGFGGADFDQIVVYSDGFHYKGDAEPFLLCCSESELHGSVRITVTTSQGESVEFEPWHNGMNGYLSLSSEIYDFTPYSDETLMMFVPGEIGTVKPEHGYQSWESDDIDFSQAQVERLILGLHDMGWSIHKIIHFLNYINSGDENCLNYVG